MDGPDSLFRRAAQAIAEADALLIGAGAGMGVDSGLPDFRGAQGFWRAYPAYEKLRLDFVSLANPRWFATDPTLAWGFYGHRRNLYRETPPHEGFQILQKWARRMRHGAFVYTSNVDGHFQRAGFPPERVLEVHGAIDFMQCTRDCGAGIFPAPAAAVGLDAATMRAREPLPACVRCGALARPNILMFGDADWNEARAFEQEGRLQDWWESLTGARLVVVECGAGTAIPTVRRFCESAAERLAGTLIRINVRELFVPDGQIGLPLGALPALRALDERLQA
jgi:NAD-dependent SIR2 family protein deacetylase